MMNRLFNDDIQVNNKCVMSQTILNLQSTHSSGPYICTLKIINHDRRLQTVGGRTDATGDRVGPSPHARWMISSCCLVVWCGVLCAAIC